MQQNSPKEFSIRLDGQEIAIFFYEFQIHITCLRETSRSISLNQINLAKTLMPYFFKIHFTIIHQTVQRAIIISGTGSAIWPDTNYGPIGHHHTRSSSPSARMHHS
jgi:hypothetical protein